MTTSGTKSQNIASGAAAQQIPNPNLWGSSTAAAYAQADYVLPVPISFGTLSYNAWIPAGAIVFRVSFREVITFTDGATVSLGSLNPGDIMVATALVSGLYGTNGATLLPALSPILRASGQPIGVQHLQIAIAGSPVAGNGYLVIEYFNTLPTPPQN